MTDQNEHKPLSPEKELLQRRQFIKSLNSLLSSIKIHQDNNRLVLECVRRFFQSTLQVIGFEDYITLQVANGRFYLQEEKLHFHTASDLIEHMLDYFSKRQLLGFRFYSKIKKASVKDILAFAHLLNDAEHHKKPMDWLVLKLESPEYNLGWVSIVLPQVSELSGQAAEEPKEADKSSSQPDEDFLQTEEGEETKKEKSEDFLTDFLDDDEDAPPQAESQSAPARPSYIADDAAGIDNTPESSHPPKRRSARRIYSYALTSMHQVAKKVSLNNRAGIKKAVRVIQNMVEEVILQDKPVLLAVSTIKVYDDYTFTHSVNVAILSMYLGKQIGLSKQSLESLGVCGLFHDLGKILVPPTILNKPKKLDDNEFTKIKWHPFNSVRLISKLRATRERKSRILIAPFEHHLKYNLQGYPKIGWNKPLSLFGRILTIADVYDALTSPRVYRPEALSADRALGIMLQESGKSFDPILLKIFINMLGIYPVGTLLKLDTEEIGLVSDKPSTEAMDRPRLIKLVWNEKHGGFTKGEEMDLADCDPQTGAFLRNIVESIHPTHYGIQPAEFLT